MHGWQANLKRTGAPPCSIGKIALRFLPQRMQFCILWIGHMPETEIPPRFTGGIFIGAGKGSRTLLSSLGSLRSTDELYPRGALAACQRITLYPNGGDLSSTVTKITQKEGDALRPLFSLFWCVRQGSPCFAVSRPRQISHQRFGRLRFARRPTFGLLPPSSRSRCP